MSGASSLTDSSVVTCFLISTSFQCNWDSKRNLSLIQFILAMSGMETAKVTKQSSKFNATVINIKKKKQKKNKITLAEVECSRTSLASRTHFEVLGLEASGPRKLPCPRLEDSTIFRTVEISLESARNLAENLRTPFLFSSLGAKA